MPPRPPRRPVAVPSRSAVVLAAVLVASACGAEAPRQTLLDCVPLVAPPDAPDPVGPRDTVRAIVALERRADPVEVLVRVDPLDEEGLVVFPPDAPPTAMGAGATVTAPALYKVCVASAPRGVVFQGRTTPRDKVWLRFSSDRPVEVAVRIGGNEGVTLTPVLTVEPGRSARRRWTIPEGGR